MDPLGENDFVDSWFLPPKSLSQQEIEYARKFNNAAGWPEELRLFDHRDIQKKYP
jgi:hypothetical protein